MQYILFEANGLKGTARNLTARAGMYFNILPELFLLALLVPVIRFEIHMVNMKVLKDFKFANILQE